MYSQGNVTLPQFIHQVNPHEEFSPWRIFSGVSLDHILPYSIHCLRANRHVLLVNCWSCKFFLSSTLNFIFPFRNTPESAAINESMYRKAHTTTTYHPMLLFCQMSVPILYFSGLLSNDKYVYVPQVTLTELRPLRPLCTLCVPLVVNRRTFKHQEAERLATSAHTFVCRRFMDADQSNEKLR